MKMKKNKFFLLDTSRGNDYVISPSIPQVHFVHPILKYLIDISQKGIVLDDWLNGIEQSTIDKIQLTPDLLVTKSDIRYYIKYLKFLESKETAPGECKRASFTGEIDLPSAQ